MKHTPGPWKIVNAQKVGAGVFIEGPKPKKTLIADMVANSEYYWDDENKANAALIAAAPEMYAFLEDLCSEMERGPVFALDILQPTIKGILSRARGEK